jgi:hypothetical protein
MLTNIPVWAIPLLLLPILPNIWSIWHLNKNEFPTPQERAAWILAQVVLPVIGGLGYILFGRKRLITKR